MRMRIGMGPSCEQPGQKIAVGEGGFGAKSDHDHIERRDHVEALLFRSDGGDEIPGAAGVELVAIDGQLQDGDGLQARIRWRPVQPKAHAISRIGPVAGQQQRKRLIGNELIGLTVPRAVDEFAEFGPFFR